MSPQLSLDSSSLLDYSTSNGMTGENGWKCVASNPGEGRLLRLSTRKPPTNTGSYKQTADHVISITCGFMTVAPLVPSYDIITSIPWYVVPTVGLSSFILGVGYFAVFRYVIPQINGKQPVVERLPVVDCNEKGGWVLRYEIMEFEWQVPERRLSEGHAMN